MCQHVTEDMRRYTDFFFKTLEKVLASLKPQEYAISVTHILVNVFYARPADADERGGFAVKPFAACKGDAIEISCADGLTIRIDLED